MKLTVFSCSRLNLKLDLPLTGIAELEDVVGMPSFNAPFCVQDHEANQASYFEGHYASQLALRRLCANLHNVINECEFAAQIHVILTLLTFL
jgi:hypothetical protein